MEEQTIIPQVPTPIKKRKIFTGLLVLIIASPFLGTALYYFLYNFSAAPPSKDPVIIETPDTKQTTRERKEEFLTYTDDKYGFMFTYLSDASIKGQVTFGGQIKTVTASYTRSGESNEENLTDGYIFKVVVFAQPDKTLEEYVNTKRNFFISTCDKNSSVSEIAPEQFGIIEISKLQVQNCPLDYVEYFLQEGANIIEIALIDKGDLGYKQQYKNTLGQIFASFKLTERGGNTNGNEETFRSFVHGFSFKHPKLDSTCCDVKGPLVGSFEKVVILGKDAGNEGIGIYVEAKALESMTFDEFINSQKSSLRENYIRVAGREPKSSDFEIVLDNVTGVTLKNYAWWADITYVPIPSSRKILVIVKSLKWEDEEAFNQIVQSWDFEN